MVDFGRLLPRALLLLFLVSSLSTASAQSPAPGSRVRILPLTGALPTEGTLIAMTPDTISVHPGLGSSRTSLPMDSVRAIDVSRGIHASGGRVVRDGAIGLVAGVGLVALIGKGICSHDASDLCGLNAVLIAVPVGLAGLVGGVVIGRNDKREEWDRIYERSPATSLIVVPEHNGVAIGLSVPFGAAAQR